MAADLGDDTVPDEHVTADNVTEARVDRDDVAGVDEQFVGHSGSQPPVFKGWGK